MVARKAGECEIKQNRSAAMLTRDDVVDFKWQFVVHLRNSAIFAAAAGAVPN
jgi:hypothetical protein